MARLSSFDNETIRFLESIPEDEALKAIANAVPMGLLSTVYTAVLDHAHATEFAYVATRHKNYDEPDHTLLPDRVLRAVDPDRAPPHREQRRVTFGGTTFAPVPTTPATPPKPRSPQPTRPPPPTKPTIAARTSTNSSAAVSDPAINPSEPQPSDGALPTTSTSPTASSSSSPFTIRLRSGHSYKPMNPFVPSPTAPSPAQPEPPRPTTPFMWFREPAAPRSTAQRARAALKSASLKVGKLRSDLGLQLRSRYDSAVRARNSSSSSAASSTPRKPCDAVSYTHLTLPTKLAV